MLLLHLLLTAQRSLVVFSSLDEVQADSGDGQGQLHHCHRHPGHHPRPADEEHRQPGRWTVLKIRWRRFGMVFHPLPFKSPHRLCFQKKYKEEAEKTMSHYVPVLDTPEMQRVRENQKNFSTVSDQCVRRAGSDGRDVGAAGRGRMARCTSPCCPPPSGSVSGTRCLVSVHLKAAACSSLELTEAKAQTSE